VILELDGRGLADPTPDSLAIRGRLQVLRDHGIRIALADLGAAGASLRGLSELPVDVLKLDRCLVADLQTNPHAATVADAVLRLGQLLRVDTIASGIENPAQAGQLAMLGFATGQGHHFARAMRAEQIRDLLTLNSVVSGLAGIRI
jgi:EAL domain-containing protein (putative c-di-GMP-specific phosphodiesterase class I)